MKLYITCLLALATPMVAAPSLYEGFDMETRPAPIGSGTTRSGESSHGWLSDWHLKAGQSKVLNKDLAMTGLQSVPGLVSSKGKTVVMRQMAETFSGDVYGSFRVRGSKLKPNSMMGLLISLPDADPLNPKTAFVSFLATRWASDLGGIVVGGKPVPVEKGTGISEQETALVLWKIDNLPEPGKKTDQVIQMWVLNEAQVAQFAAGGMQEKALSKAKSGTEPDQVLQYAQVTTKGSKLTLVKGLLVSCFSTDVPMADFDEIRISPESLAKAAGVGDSKTN